MQPKNWGEMCFQGAGDRFEEENALMVYPSPLQNGIFGLPPPKKRIFPMHKLSLSFFKKKLEPIVVASNCFCQ
jgi:hypothetical protein